MNQQRWKLEYSKGHRRCRLVLDDAESAQRHLKFAYDARDDRGISVWLSADLMPLKVSRVTDCAPATMQKNSMTDIDVTASTTFVGPND